ncbi:MAG: hypothetical protein ABF679_06980 [Lentilactobacillus diolivorans]|uniref:hypothetical protein n=1 Tax=Lentilactobacillus diolivorans TaxID=179838 RepID=UPI0039EB2D72
MQNETNYYLYQRLTPTNWASALFAKSARTELERRANNGDGEAKMLLTLHDCEEEKRSRQPIKPVRRVRNFKERAAKIKIFYHLTLG